MRGEGRELAAPQDTGLLLTTPPDHTPCPPPPRHQSSSVQATATALSDTEVEIKDRLSSKLWEWSAGRTRLPEQEVSNKSLPVVSVGGVRVVSPAP